MLHIAELAQSEILRKVALILKSNIILSQFKRIQNVNNEWIIVPEEAEIIRKIYRLYLEGSTLQQIKEYLEEHHIKTATGKETWATAVIQKILKNKKYKGDSLLQKTYTEDFITGKKARMAVKEKTLLYNE